VRERIIDALIEIAPLTPVISQCGSACIINHRMAHQLLAAIALPTPHHTDTPHHTTLTRHTTPTPHHSTPHRTPHSTLHSPLHTLIASGAQPAGTGSPGPAPFIPSPSIWCVVGLGGILVCVCVCACMRALDSSVVSSGCVCPSWPLQLRPAPLQLLLRVTVCITVVVCPAACVCVFVVCPVRVVCLSY
jgi:hypothetical protein